MKKIKRSISILLIAMMALAMLGGCGNNSTSGNSTANGDSAKATEKTADAGEAKGTESNPFILGVSPMSGWYAWYGVKDTGIFEQNGVYVDLQFFPVYSDSLTAFYSGQVDGICIAASDAVAPVNEGVDFKVVLVNDNSYGADGIVVQDGINSIEDLKGKTVATEVGTLEHMFLLKILEENNMTVDDVNFVNMTINDAGPAFIAGSIDAAVLWEPTLSTAIGAGGKLLYSTKEEPGLMVLKKLNARDDDFIQAICDGAELTRDDYMTMLDGVTIFDKAKNEETFKDGDDYTYLSYTLQKSAEFLLSTKMIDEIPDDLSSILDDTYIKGAE